LFILILIIYLIIIRINIIIVIYIKFVIVIDLYNFLNTCFDNCKDCKNYKNYYCFLCCYFSYSLFNNYIFIFVNLLYIFIKNLYIYIYYSKNINFKFFLLFLFNLVAIIISFNCVFAIAQDFNNCIDILKTKEISSSKLCFYFFCSSYNIFLVSIFLFYVTSCVL